MQIAMGTSERPRNPLGVLAVASGLVGALVSVVLWLYQQRPDWPLLGDLRHEIVYGGPLRVDLIQLAALLGVVAIGSALLSTLGGRATSSTVVAVIGGVIALTFPLAERVVRLEAPLHVNVFPLG